MTTLPLEFRRLTIQNGIYSLMQEAAQAGDEQMGILCASATGYELYDGNDRLVDWPDNEDNRVAYVEAVVASIDGSGWVKMAPFGKVRAG